MPEAREVSLRDAKAQLSSIVNEVKNGQPAIITRHGRREAVVLGYEEWERLRKVPSFADLLLAAPIEPGDIPERDQTPLRDIDF